MYVNKLLLWKLNKYLTINVIMNAALRWKLCALFINFNLHLDCQICFLRFISLMCRTSKQSIWKGVSRCFCSSSSFPQKPGITLCHVFPQLFVSSQAGPIVRLTITVKTCFPTSACGEFSEAQWLPLLLSMPPTKTQTRQSMQKLGFMGDFFLREFGW